VLVPLFVLFLLFSFPASAHAEKALVPFDHSEWDQFLKRFVNEKGEVQYRSALKERQSLDAYLEKLKSIPGKALRGWPREERLALFINAYNAGVIKLVLDHYPIRNMLDIPGVWELPAVSIGTHIRSGSPVLYSLNQIQAGLLRKGFRDEKILFALSSGAKASPPLQREAYEGAKVEGQLYVVTRRFANDETRNRIEPEREKVVLSRLFKWYGNDFLLNWGDFPEEPKWDPQEMAVLSFFAHYLEDTKKVEFLQDGKYKVKYEVFDWRLNEWVEGAAGRVEKS